MKIPCALAAFLALGCSGAGAASPMSLDLKLDRGEVEVRFHDRKVMVYAFATNQFKPYVRELYTLRGENVLRDAPPDHLHHHGLMYAVALNGVNFWEERDAPGIERPVEVLSYMAGKDATGLPQAQFVQLIHWLAPGDRQATNSAQVALLFEQRTLTLTANESAGEIALVWDSEFEAGPRPGKLKLHGANYNGLGLRLPESFNHVAQFHNSSGRPYTGNNTQNVIPAEWTSVAGAIDGREVLLALFGNPSNQSGDGKFFTMLDPFAYLAVTQGLDEQPLEYSPGQKFRLRYLLAVYSQSQPRDAIASRYQRWIKETN